MFNILIFISLMLNPVTLATKLTGLIGVRQPVNPEYQIIDAANQASRSGYYLNDNPFVKVEFIKDSQDYVGSSDVDFNIFIRNKISTSIINVGNAIFNEQDYIDRQLIYKNALNKFSQTDPSGVNTYTLPAGFNCYWFQISKEKNIAFKIERVFLEFDGSGDITLLLFNTADLKTPLKTKTISVTSPCQEVLLDWVCDNTGNGYKGDYYLGYFSDGMTIKPYRREYRDGTVMSIIDKVDYERACFGSFTDLSKPFDLLGRTVYNYYNGVNPDITVYEDFTDMMIQNEKLFARAIQLDCQINMLTEVIASVRSNRNERISNQQIANMMAQIEGETGDGNAKVKGLRPQFYGAISAIKKEFSKLREGYSDAGQIMFETIS